MKLTRTFGFSTEELSFAFLIKLDKETMIGITHVTVVNEISLDAFKQIVLNKYIVGLRGDANMLSDDMRLQLFKM